MDAFLGSNTGAILLLVIADLVLVALLILQDRKVPLPDMRPVPGIRDLQDEVGRTAESGGAIHIALGSGGLSGEDAITSLAGLQVVEAVTEAAVSYHVPPVITVGDPTLLFLAQDVMRRAYERRGIAELYDPTQVRFVAPSPVAYAAGAADVVAAEDVTANVVVGAFGSEATLIAHAGTRCGLPQFAAVDASRAAGALYPVIADLAVGEELYATGAELTRDRRYLVSLLTQDVLRVVLVLVILGVSLLALVRGVI